MQINRVKNSSEENQYMISENYSRTTYTDIYNTNVGKEDAGVDTLELSGDDNTPIISDNYSNASKSVISEAKVRNFLCEEDTKIIYLMDAYSRNEVTETDVKNCMYSEFYNIKSFYSNPDYLKDHECKTDSQILGRVYERMQKYNAVFMAQTCMLEGDKLAEMYGFGDNKRNVYYDSYYYNRCQETRRLLRETADEIAEQFGIKSPDYDDIEKNSPLVLDGGLDFNSCWNHQAVNRSICILNPDWSIKPGDNFTFFYSRYASKLTDNLSPLESQKGICIIGYNGNTWTIGVPFNDSTSLGPLADNFNVKELMLRTGTAIDATLLAYLDNFNVHTRAFSFEKEMSGNMFTL